jgi:outer membrane lipoprotein LolB
VNSARILPRAVGLLRVCTLVAIAALAGCAQPALRPVAPGVTPHDLHLAHVSAIGALYNWRLAGRLAVQAGAKGFSADLDWRESAAGFDLRVAAPLNRGTFALSGNASAVSLVTPKGETYTAADAETLMHQHLGWALPLAGVRYWVRGLPDPALPLSAEHLDSAGRWTDFAQDGWQVRVLEYRVAAGLDLPSRLRLSHDKLQVRMAIKRWERL